MQMTSHRLQVATSGKGLYEITAQIAAWLESAGVRAGLLTVFDRLVPEDNRLYRHTMEGPDDMPAHIRAALTLTQVSIPVEHGRMALGDRKSVYLFEHRAAPHRRGVLL